MPANLDRRAFVGLGLLWLGSTSARAATDDIDVRGVWSSVIRTGEKGEKGEQMILTSRNATLTEGVVWDASYAIDGSSLTITPGERIGPPQTYQFEIVGNKLILREPGTRPSVMTRDGKFRFGADPIVGDWRTSAEVWGVELRIAWRFSRGGAWQLALVSASEIDKGPYRIVGDSMQIELARQGPVTLTVKRQGNLLITRDAAGNEKQFVKFEYDRAAA